MKNYKYQMNLIKIMIVIHAFVCFISVKIVHRWKYSKFPYIFVAALHGLISWDVLLIFSIIGKYEIHDKIEIKKCHMQSSGNWYQRSYGGHSNITFSVPHGYLYSDRVDVLCPDNSSRYLSNLHIPLVGTVVYEHQTVYEDQMILYDFTEDKNRRLRELEQWEEFEINCITFSNPKQVWSS